MKTKHFLLCCIAVLCSINTFAHDFEVDGIYYNKLGGDSVAVSFRESSSWSYSNEYSGSVTIPATVTYSSTTYRVTSIGENAFYYCSGVTSIIIPNSVTSIGNSAFYSCDGLTSITIPNSVIKIGEYVFHWCSHLQSIKIGSGVTEIPSHAFSYCSNLLSLEIGENVTSIGQSAFEGCNNLSKIIIPDKVETIGEKAFFDCYANVITLGSGITSIAAEAFYCDDVEIICKAATPPAIEMNTFVYPDYYANNPAIYYTENVSEYKYASVWDKYSLLYISDLYSYVVDGIYYKSDYKYVDGSYKGVIGVTINPFGHYPDSLAIPETISSGAVVEIDFDAFRGNPNLTTITIPKNITWIGYYAFADCPNLKTIMWNAKKCDDLQSYSQIFDSSPIETFTFGEDVTHVPAYVLSGSDSLKTLAIPENITSIGKYAFANCDNIKTIIWNAKKCTDLKSDGPIFGNSSIDTIIFGEAVTHIPGYVLYNSTSLKAITIPENITSIGTHAFAHCDSLKALVWNAKKCSDFSSLSYIFDSSPIETFTFGEKVEYIPSYLCYQLNNITSIDIPNSVTEVGNYTFDHCANLKTVNIPKNTTALGENLFTYCPKLATINVDSKNPLFHNKGNNLITKRTKTLLHGTLNSIIPSDGSVTKINDYAFCGSGLRSVNIPDKVTNISTNAFRDCLSLQAVTIGAGLTTLAEYTFYNCDSLAYIQLPNNVTSIGKYAFYSSGLRSIDIHDQVTNIYTNAFQNCTSLQAVTIGAGLTTLAEHIFDNCDSLEYILLPDNITSIGNNAFYGCNGLVSITLPLTLKTLGNSVFSGCNKLADITIPNSVTSMGTYLFQNSGVKDVTLPSNITSLSNYMFQNCDSLETFIIPKKVKTIGQYTFSGCDNLTSVTIPNSVTTINAYAFNNCTKLNAIALSNNITSLGNYSFYGCTGLDSLQIGNGITSVGSNSFAGCTNLVYASVGNGIMTLNGLFANCTQLKDVMLGTGITSITTSDFSGCTALESVSMKRTTPPTLAKKAFPANTRIIVPCGCSDTYWKDDIWASYLYFEENALVDWYVVSGDEDRGTVKILQGPIDCDNPTAMFEAISLSGYKFNKWNDGNTENPRTVDIVSNITYTASFIEDDAHIKVTNIALDKSAENIYVGNTLQLYATITPNNASNPNVTWHSSNKAVATVNDTGLVTGIKKGTTTIMVTSEESAYTAQCTINVLTALTDIQLNITSLSLHPYESYYLNASITPVDADIDALIWTSSNEDVATVDRGFISANAIGKTTIKVATADNSHFATCEVTVSEETPVTGITLAPQSVEMAVGTIQQLTASVIPANATNQTIHWTSGNSGVASVDDSGLVTAENAGSTIILATTEEGNYATYCMVTVKNKEDMPTDLDYTQSEDGAVRKVFKNGTIYILRNGEKYTIDGRRLM